MTSYNSILLSLSLIILLVPNSSAIGTRFSKDLTSAERQSVDNSVAASSEAFDTASAKFLLSFLII